MYHIHAYSGPGIYPSSNAKPDAVPPSKTGEHATKWPPAAQAARPAGHIF
jgi:hypothetical protein